MTTIGSALLIGRLDLKRRLRDRSILIQVFLAPILLALIVGAAFGGTAASLSTTIVIADADQTQTSRAITSAFAAQSEEGGVVFEARSVTGIDEVSAAVEGEGVGAAVVIPAGFTDAVMAGSAAELIVVGTAGDTLPRSVAQSVADGIAATAQSRRVSATTASVTAQQFGATIDPAALADLLQQPPIIAVQDTRVTSTFSLMSYFAPAMAMIFLFFVMGAAARSLMSERREGTLSRILAGPTPPTAVLLGKACAVFALGMLSLLTVYLVTTFAFGADWGDPIGVLLVITAVVVAIAGISLVITGLARTEQQAESLTIIGTLILAVLGGSFVFTGSGLFAQLRAYFPNGQALMAFLDLSAGEADWVVVLPRVLILLAMGLITGAIGLVAIRRGMAR